MFWIVDRVSSKASNHYTAILLRNNATKFLQLQARNTANYSTTDGSGKEKSMINVSSCCYVGWPKFLPSSKVICVSLFWPPRTVPIVLQTCEMTQDTVLTAMPNKFAVIIKDPVSFK